MYALLLGLVLVAAARGSLVFGPGLDKDIPCWRIPALVAFKPSQTASDSHGSRATPSQSLLAFAGSRCYPGDGCNPLGWDPSKSAKHALIGYRRSDDQGKTWGPLRVLVSLPCEGRYPGSRILQPNVAYDDVHDVIHVMYSNSSDTLVVQSSNDRGDTWSDPITLSFPCDTAPGNGLVLQSGRVLLLGQCGGSEGAYLVASDDSGKSWKLLKGQTVPGNVTNEPQAVQLNDGTVYLRGHTTDFKPDGMLVPAASVSTDEGNTWTRRDLEPPFNLTTCAGGLSLAVPSSQDLSTSSVLLFSHPNVPAAESNYAASRYNGTVWASIDNGVRWHPVLQITGPTMAAEYMFSYSVMSPLYTSTSTRAAIGMLFETGNSSACGQDPRYRDPASSCQIVYKTLSIDIGL